MNDLLQTCNLYHYFNVIRHILARERTEIPYIYLCFYRTWANNVTSYKLELVLLLGDKDTSGGPVNSPKFRYSVRMGTQSWCVRVPHEYVT